MNWVSFFFLNVLYKKPARTFFIKIFDSVTSTKQSHTAQCFFFINYSSNNKYYTIIMYSITIVNIITLAGLYWKGIKKRIKVKNIKSHFVPNKIEEVYFV